MKKPYGIFEKIAVFQFHGKYGFFILNAAFYETEYSLLSSKTWQHCHDETIPHLSKKKDERALNV